MSTRPTSIIWFERTQYAIFSLGLINTILTPGGNRQLTAQGPILFWLVALVAFGFLMLFVWLIAYRGSNIAKWLFLVLNGLGLLVLLNIGQILAEEGTRSVAITLIQSALQLVSLWMLFRADSRIWFAGRRPIDPAVFD